MVGGGGGETRAGEGVIERNAASGGRRRVMVPTDDTVMTGRKGNTDSQSRGEGRGRGGIVRGRKERGEAVNSDAYTTTSSIKGRGNTE